MAVLSASVQRPVKLPAGGLTTRVYKMAGYTNFAGGNTAHSIYKGSVVVCDVTDTDGYVRAMPLSSSTAMTSSDIFAGVAIEKQDVTSSNTADGSVVVTCAVNGVWGFPVGGLAITDLGATIFASDDNTATSTSANNIAIGKLVDVDATYAWIDISDYAGKVSTETT